MVCSTLFLGVDSSAKSSEFYTLSVCTAYYVECRFIRFVKINMIKPIMVNLSPRSPDIMVLNRWIERFKENGYGNGA